MSFQYSISWAQLFWYPQNFWGQGPDLITTVFGMYNHINLPNGQNDPYDNISKLKFGAEVMYLPLPMLGFGGRYDYVDPDFGKDNSERLSSPFLSKFQVISPRVVLRTDFVTHEQILIQYSRYMYQDGYPAAAVFPYNNGQAGSSNIGASDKNAFQIAAIIWF